MVSRNRAPSFLLALGLLLVQPVSAALAPVDTSHDPVDAGRGGVPSDLVATGSGLGSGPGAGPSDLPRAVKDLLVTAGGATVLEPDALVVPARLPPTHLGLDVVGDDVVLSWMPPPSAPVVDAPVAYRVYRVAAPLALDPTGVAQPLATAVQGVQAPVAEVPAGTTTYTDGDVDLGNATYVYHVTAVYPSGPSLLSYLSGSGPGVRAGDDDESPPSNPASTATKNGDCPTVDIKNTPVRDTNDVDIREECIVNGDPIRFS